MTLAATPLDTLQLKVGSKPSGVDLVGIEIQTSAGAPIGTAENADGIFPISSILPGQPAGNYKIRGRYQGGGLWGDYNGTWVIITLAAPAPPVDSDWEIAAA